MKLGGSFYPWKSDHQLYRDLGDRVVEWGGGGIGNELFVVEKTLLTHIMYTKSPKTVNYILLTIFRFIC